MAVSAVKGKSAPSLAKQISSTKNLVKKDASGLLQKSSLYSTVDKGRLHVAVGEKYAGSIDSYNNFFTRLFARIFGKSTQIALNGTTYHVNKADLASWLDQNIATSEEDESPKILGYVNFNELKIAPKIEGGLMRDHLTVQKTRELFEKMVTALVNNDTRTAEECVGSGARVDDYFWVRKHKLVLSFTDLQAGLPEDKAITSMDAGYFTPLLYAAAMGKKAFCDFLQTFQANTTLQGGTVLFTKKILEADSRSDVVKSEQFSPENSPVRTKVTLKTTVTLQIEDEVTPQYILSFDPNTNTVNKEPSNAPMTSKTYERIQENYTVQYLPRN